MLKKVNKTKLVLWFFYAVLVTTMFSSSTLARYTSTVDGSDSVSVAAVYLGTQIDDVNIVLEDLQPGGVAEYIISITNTTQDGIISGVEQKYSFSISYTENMPFEYDLIPVDEDGNELADADALGYATGNDLSEFTGGVMPYTQTIHYYKLIVTWSDEDDDYDNWNYSNEIELITIIADSVQAGL